jgi:hypothetical protein
MANVLVPIALILQLFFTAFASVFASPEAAAPQQTVGIEFQVEIPVVDFESRTITFQVKLVNADPIAKAFIYLKPEGQDAEFYPLSVSPEGLATYVLNTQSPPLRVFTQVTYAFQVELPTGGETKSKEFQVEYADNRFDWKYLSDATFEIFYYDRDIDFGQTALNTAARGLEEAYKLVPAVADGPIRVYIYRDPRDLQASQQGLQPWVAGHAAPDLRMVLISIPSGPEQRLELERQLPHELVHILQYQALGKRALNLPVWLLEGSASVAEFYKNPEYSSVLKSSAEQDRLLHFSTLCESFPRDASGAFLAYAQSQSFVQYLLDSYGSSGLKTLYQNYADGMNCAAGFEATYGAALSEVEYRWRLEALGINPAALVLRNLLPYLLFFLIVFSAAAVTMIFAARRRKAE